jgi:hypothetical protein
MSGRIEDCLKELRTLPEIEPPAGLEHRTVDAMAAVSVAHKHRRFARAATWIVAIGVGILLATVTLKPEEPVEPDDASLAAEQLYIQWSQESQRLEQILAELPQRRVMRVSTAGTIAGLEDQIALIDAQLTRADGGTIAPAYRAALMRNRVDVMSALVNVRYAQSRAFNFE